MSAITITKANAEELACEMARQILQKTARDLRDVSDAFQHQSKLVNAAAQVEAIFDSLYPVRAVADEPAPQTRRSA